MKILVVRFSSIGDIVLTTPVIRALKVQIPNAEIHFLTKQQFSGLLENNPHVDHLHTMKQHINEVVDALRKEKFDWVIDLHHNLRTFSLKQKLGRPSKAVNKLNWQKWLMVRFKWNRLPKIHVVDRYFETVKHLGVKNDGMPGDFVIAENDVVNIHSTFGVDPGKYITVAIGAQFATKQFPIEKLALTLEKVKAPIILVGGSMDKEKAEDLIAKLKDNTIFNSCGKYTIAQSASIVGQSSKLLTNDTGMMHIAACLNVPIISVWGNTIPDFGMYPYLPNQPKMFTIHEVDGLSCRPCSKIGFQKCPKGHFKCMLDQDAFAIADDLNKLV